MPSYSKISWQNEIKAGFIVLMLHDCITYGISMTGLWWMGVVKIRYQLSSTSRYFLSMVTP